MIHIFCFNIFVFFITFLFSCDIDSVIPDNSKGVKQGQKYFQQANWEAAEASFTQAIKDDSSDSRAYIGLIKSLKQKVELNKLIAKIIKKESNTPIQKILDEDLDDLTQYLSVLPRINNLLNIFYVRDTAGKMNNIINFKQYSVDLVATSFISLFIVSQDIDSNGIINAADTAIIAPILNEFKKSSIKDIHIRIIKQVDTIIRTGISSGGSLESIRQRIESISQRILGINTFLEISSQKAKQFANALTILSATIGDSSKEIEELLKFKTDIREMANTLAYYAFFDKKDNDGDGRIDEEMLNDVDDDADGLIDEDTQLPMNLQLPMTLLPTP